MRLGIFSDIHANLPALEAVLADMASREFDRMSSRTRFAPANSHENLPLT